jgi:hypothetical protein
MCVGFCLRGNECSSRCIPCFWLLRRWRRGGGGSIPGCVQVFTIRGQHPVNVFHNSGAELSDPDLWNIFSLCEALVANHPAALTRGFGSNRIVGKTTMGISTMNSELRELYRRSRLCSGGSGWLPGPIKSFAGNLSGK